MRRVLVLVLLSLAVVWLPAAGSAGTARTADLVISKIDAVFSQPDRQTTYSVHANEDNVTIAWTLSLQAVDQNKGVDAGCNNHGVLTGTGASFVWHHGNTGDPVHDDGCNHDLQGKYGHQGLITVRVTDATGSSCETTYKGTLSSDAATAAGLDVQSEPVCRQAPHSKQCKCIRMTTRILFPSLSMAIVRDAKGYEGARIKFTVHWTLACTGGTVHTCSGYFFAIGSRGGVTDAEGTHHVQDFLDATGEHTGSVTKCEGPCGQVTEGASTITMRILGLGRAELAHVGRVYFDIDRHCKRTPRSYVDRYWFAFDKFGRLDAAKSKLQ